MYDNSTPIGGKISSVRAALINAISKMPESWALTLCVDKRNLWPNWNKTKLDRDRLIEAIRSQTNHEGKKTLWTGVSIVTGPLSSGIMAIDFDGPAAWKKYLELSDNQAPPFTNHWTSGKPGHFQILLSVPPEKWEGLKPQKIELENGNKLELRWNQCSTLPPSIHPDTGKPYFWESDTDTPIAECPDFILDLMREVPAIELPQKPKPENPISADADEKSLVDKLEQEILPRLDAEEFYGSYIKLKTSGKNLKGLCPFHDEKTASFTISPEEKTFHCFGCSVGGGPVQFIHQLRGGSGSPTGKDFYSVVMELADRVGVKIGDRKFKQNPKSDNVLQHPTTNNVVRPKEFQIPDISELGEEIENLLESDLKKSQLQLKISELAQKFRVNSADVWKIYRDREQEQEQADNREDVATEVARLLNSKKSQINIAEIIPVGLAAPIEKLAKMLNLKPECYLTTLLTQISSLFKVGSEIKLRNDTNYRVTPNYFAGIVAESSQKKSPIMREIIDRPMQPLRERARKEFEKAQEAYERELATWRAAKGEDKGVAPKPPRQKLYSFSKTTGEGILYQVAEHPDQALMYRCDELAGLFKSANQYRGGKGSDDEDLLEFWNGTGSTVLRASGVKADLDGLLLSVFGTIQPDVLASLLKDCSDSNGKFARFDFVIQPLAASKLSLEDSGSFDLTPMLSSLYQKIDALPALKLELEPDAKRYFTEFYNKAEDKRVAEPMQGKRAMIGKAPEKVGKLAGVLHALNCTFNDQPVTSRIPKSIVQAAVKFVIFTANQIDVLYTEFSDRTALAPNLVKILALAEAKGGTVSARDVTQAFDSKHRPSKQQIQEWFAELIEMKYGETTIKGQRISFTISPHSTVSTVAPNRDGESDTHIHTSLSTVSTVSTVKQPDNVKSVDKCG
ncbi:DUF3987 domain-containing protein [Microcoleus sp. F10-C6]|uniref:DUF3987 domain-containing protein n=1 Tax=unclassified Microcoleus TaxID=2642155 RepID=UPI002FCF41C4